MELKNQVQGYQTNMWIRVHINAVHVNSKDLVEQNVVMQQ